MPFITDDPLADFERHDAEQERWLKRRPRCYHCNQHIQDETAYCINDEWICDECLVEHYQKYIDDYIE